MEDGTPVFNTIRGGEGNDTIGGTGYLYGDEGNDELQGTGILVGGDGDDALYGYAATIDGGMLNGNNVADIYVFGRDYGADTVTDTPVYTLSDGTIQGTSNTIKLLEGVAESDIVLNRIGPNLLLLIQGTTDQLIIKNYFLDQTL